MLSLPSGVDVLADLVTGLPWVDRPKAEITAVNFEAYLVLQPTTNTLVPRVEIVTHSVVESAGSKKYALVVEALARGVIEKAERRFRDLAQVFSERVLGTSDVQLVRGVEQLDIRYVDPDG